MVKFGIAVLLVGLGSCGLTSLCGFRRWPSFIIACLILSYAQLVLATEILSAWGAIQPGGFLVFHAVVAAAVIAWVWAKRPVWPAFSLPSRESRLFFVSEHKLLLFLAAAVFLVAVIGVGLVLSVPPNTNDSMGYHLSRAGYWLQQGSLSHYNAPNLRQIVFPPNAEIVVLWLITFLRSDLLAGFVQWVAYLGLLVGVYALARQLEFSLFQAVFAGLTWALLPIVVLESTSTQNDLVVSFCVVACLYFFIQGVREGKYAAFLLCGTAMGLALGTKANTWLFLPGLGLAALIFAWKEGGRDWIKRFSLWIGCSLLGFALFGAYNYILNWRQFGSPFGPRELVEKHNVVSSGFKTLWANVGRLSYNFLDFSCFPGVVARQLTRLKHQVALPLFSFLGMPVNDPNSLFDGIYFSWWRYRFNEDTAWFGPLGFLILLLAVWYSMAFPLTSLRKNLQSASYWINSRWLIAAVAVGYFLALCWVMRWQPWSGRFLIPMAALAAPLLAVLYPDGTTAWAAPRRVFLYAITCLTIALGIWSAIHNENKQLVGWTSIWGKTQLERRCVRNEAQIEIIRYVEDNVPQSATLGLMLWGNEVVSSNAWDYPFFGEEFRRRLVPLRKEPLSAEFFRRYGLDFLLLSGGSYRPSPDIERLKTVTIIPGWHLSKLREE